MEDNKYICPECGAIMDVVYNKPALNLNCPKCGYALATTVWEEIDLDDTKYSMYLKVVINPSINQIRFVSNMTGVNYITSKSMLEKGALLFEGSAVDTLANKKELEKNNISFSIEPLFKY